MTKKLLIWPVQLHRVSKNVTILIMNNVYKPEPILIIFDTLYAETTSV